ncbi:hypothetical protein ACFRR7_34900 [Streptomyces sp. NPDC056909]|uniref:hypothetical protein n=1 Tax=Streptomyces sp. NPDC056909 TaxID=3345963 RepID=UPI0036A3C3D1
MTRPSFFRRCGRAPGALTPEDQAAIDELDGRADTVVPGFTARAVRAPFAVSGHESYSDPSTVDPATLLAAALAGAST